MIHILRTDEGESIEIVTMDGLPQGCPLALLASSLAMGDPEHEFFQNIAFAGTNPTHLALRRCMGGMTLIATPQVAEQCCAELKEALTKAGLKLNEDKCTAWTTDGKPQIPQKSETSGKAPATTEAS